VQEALLAIHTDGTPMIERTAHAWVRYRATSSSITCAGLDLSQSMCRSKTAKRSLQATITPERRALSS
jgi:hypothetical protein